MKFNKQSHYRLELNCISVHDNCLRSSKIFIVCLQYKIFCWKIFAESVAWDYQGWSTLSHCCNLLNFRENFYQFFWADCLPRTATSVFILVSDNGENVSCNHHNTVIHHPGWNMGLIWQLFCLQYQWQSALVLMIRLHENVFTQGISFILESSF